MTHQEIRKAVTLEHLAFYLPYGLRIAFFKHGVQYRYDKLNSLVINFNGACVNLINSIRDIKPILRPLSDLTKEIEHNGEKINVQYLIDAIRLGVQPYQYIDSAYDIELNIETEDYSQNIDLFDGYKIVQILLKYHFDIFGLIKQNLAIDINTLEK